MAKKDEDVGYLLDSSGNRVRSSSGEYVRTSSYDIDADMESARKKLAQEVQDMVKAKSDSDRVSKDAEEGAKAPAAAPVKQPTRPIQGAAKAKPAVVTKEQLAKSGLSLRDYMNKQRGLTRRDGKSAEKASSKASAPAVSSSYRSEGANKAKPAASSGNVSSAAPAAKPKALAISSGVLKQREADEKRREERREFGRQRDAKKKEESAAKDQMSPGQRSAARGKAVKEFFGMAKGGSVRGSGIAQRGVRKCKMV